MRLHLHNLAFVGAALLGLTISACISASQAPCPAGPPAPVICPPLRPWSAADQQAALLEYTSLPAKATLRQFVLDYKAMRDAARACRGLGPGGTIG